MNPEIYLDNNATTHLSSAVRDAINSAVGEDFGNPSSEHRSGEKSRRAIMWARDSVARLLGTTANGVLFGSGVTELNYWVISQMLLRSHSAHLVTTEVEHSCVLETANALEAKSIRVTRLPVCCDGRIDLKQLLQAIEGTTSLVSVQWVNNETGVVQPVQEIAEICAGAKVPFHCDAAQAMGKLKIEFAESKIDYLTVSAHKMHGPAGIGALCVKDPVTLSPMLRGGSQERGLRPGTENLFGIIGFGAAANERADSLTTTIGFVTALRNRFESKVLDAVPDVEINGTTTHRVGSSTNLMFPGLDGAAIVALLDREGIRCSQSSACTSNRPEPSYVLRAMGRSEEQAFASVRFSFSILNTMSQIETAASKLVAVVDRLSGFHARRTTESLQGAIKHEV